ncbi:MAG: hypothetical protein AB7Q37_18615 [Pyrinomonadaceae bacterium]
MQRRFALIKHTHDLGDIGDFSVSSPLDGQVLEYDSGTSKWVNVDVASLAALPEAVQDLVGAMLLDTASVNLTYNDGTGQLSADVLPAGVDHDSLLNFVADEHVAHSGVTLTAGAGLTGGGTIAASRTFAVGAGTGITVNADDVALSAAALASLALADSAVQPGDNVSVLTNDAGYITSTSLPVGASPSASVGLTVVNGSASTFMRSDAAPPLDVSIAPTWTGTHTFKGTTGSHTIVLSSSLPRLRLIEEDVAADNRVWALSANAGNLELGLFNDAMSANQYALRISRTGQTVKYIDMSPAAQVYVGNGSASAPSLSFLSDADKGFYHYDSSTIGVSVGGVLKASFGGSSTVLTLHANDSSGDVYMAFYESNALSSRKGFIGYADSGTDNFYIRNEENSSIILYANNVRKADITEGPEALRLFSNDSSGDVYIAFYESNAASNRKGFVGYPNLGNDGFAIWNQENDSMTFGTNNTSRLQITAGGQVNLVGDGSASEPALAFNNDTNTGIYRIGADQLGFAEGGTGYRIGYRDIPRRTSGWARGEALAVSSGVTLNTSDMATGYAFSVYNDSASAITITQGAGVTLRLSGTATTGNRTLAARGFATIWCNSGTEATIMGNVT